MEMLPLPPRYSFHPTDVELTLYHLKRKLQGNKLLCNTVTEVDIYKYAHCDLLAKSSVPTGDLNGISFALVVGSTLSGQELTAKPKLASGKDRQVVCESHTVGMKRSLVFHAGKVPKGTRTD
ncbi:NAC domain-containing protein 82-like [Aegilops tauschii subsp. strangulata]|uniref:NAC domain-containing protein 82-like n=1 Tax=Aegilops tauschii subsp. strangulata TaxID=200361 RepID=UPI003CC89D25